MCDRCAARPIGPVIPIVSYIYFLVFERIFLVMKFFVAILIFSALLATAFGVPALAMPIFFTADTDSFRRQGLGSLRQR